MVLKWFTIKGKVFHSTRNPKTILQAFDKTFEKWDLISCGCEPDNNLDSCGLCNLFNKHSLLLDTSGYCVGCPIYKVTGSQFCNNTPYVIMGNEDFKTSIEINFLKAVRKAYLYDKRRAKKNTA